tara:strand:- start:2220 stop:2357 length:138 start_codon:yes stop_codon:yes gene_type:complete
MKARRKTQLDIMKYYQRLENEERRRQKTAEEIKEQKGFLKKLFGK